MIDIESLWGRTLQWHDCKTHFDDTLNAPIYLLICSAKDNAFVNTLQNPLSRSMQNLPEMLVDLMPLQYNHALLTCFRLTGRHS